MNRYVQDNVAVVLVKELSAALSCPLTGCSGGQVAHNKRAFHPKLDTEQTFVRKHLGTNKQKVRQPVAKGSISRDNRKDFVGTT